MAMGSIESVYSGVSSWRVRSKPEPIDFKEGVSPRMPEREELPRPFLSPLPLFHLMMPEREELPRPFLSPLPLFHLIMVIKTPQRDKERRDEREAQREREKRAEREARLRKKRISMSGLFDEPFQLYPDNSPPRMAERETLPGPFHEPLLLHAHWPHLRRAERETAAQLERESRLDLSSFQKKHDVSDEGFFESPDNQMSERSLESSDSGVSLQSDQSKGEPLNFKDRDSPRMAEKRAQPKKKKRAEEKAWLEMHIMATKSLESIDSGVSLKSGQSKDELLYFKDRVSPRLADFSSSEKKHDVSDDEGVVKSPDDLMALRRTQSEPVE